MPEYDRTDISEGIDVTKTNASKERDICHYEPYLCDGCHDLIQKAMNFNDVAIFYVKENDCRIHFWYMSKDDAILV